jgi:L-xylulose reductase
MKDFNGRTILVTGASGGIGGTTVRLLAENGADVVASAREKESLATLATQTGARTVSFDLRDELGIAAALADIDLWGVVNCAGDGGELAPPQDADMAIFDRVMAVNARGALVVTKYAARSMIRGNHPGSIVNVSSQAGLIALHGHVSYGASKAALDSITRVSALELGPYGIRVNSVNPTVIMTKMSEHYWGRPEIGEPYLARMPLGRWATEEEVAKPIMFLLGDDASMITGVALPVDGGFTAC